MNLKKSSLLLFAAAALCAAPAVVHADDYSSTDRQIQRDAKKNMPDAISDRVTIQSRDGVVTLTGTVMSEGQRRMAVDAVKQVPDVKDVNDEIRVDNGNGNNVAMKDQQEPADHHSDKWIAFKIKSSLLTHSDVSATHTDVNVLNGVVTLSGTAKTQAQKDLTAQYAREVQGVRDVRNEMQVRDESTFTGDQQNSKTDDSTITAKVKFQLAKHRSTSAIHTSVHTENGRVFISGTADNQAEKDLVTRLAKDTPGVQDVQNDMTIRQP